MPSAMPTGRASSTVTSSRRTSCSRASIVSIADFGVARALDAAGGERLTETGIAFGTPAVHESGAGERRPAARWPERHLLPGLRPLRDARRRAAVHRSHGAGDHGQAAAGAGAAPAHPARHRARRAGAGLTKALARSPADRFQSAGEVARALSLPSSVAAPTGPPSAGAASLDAAHPATGRGGRCARADRPGRRRNAIPAMRSRELPPRETLLEAGILAQRERLLLADFGTRQVDSSLGGVLTEAFRIDLAQSPAVTLVSSVQVAEVLARMERPDTARLNPALAREIAVREGIKGVVTGEIARAGPQYVLSAQVIAARTGRC